VEVQNCSRVSLGGKNRAGEGLSATWMRPFSAHSNVVGYGMCIPDEVGNFVKARTM